MKKALVLLLVDIPGIASSTTDVRLERAVIDFESGAPVDDDTVIAAITGLGSTASPDT